MSIRVYNRLTDIYINNLKPKEKPYKVFDGGGLFIYILPRNTTYPNGIKRFRWNYRFHGIQTTLSLGTFPETSLEEARKSHIEYRKNIKSGINPSDLRKKEKFNIIKKRNNISMLSDISSCLQTSFHLLEEISEDIKTFHKFSNINKLISLLPKVLDELSELELIP